MTPEEACNFPLDLENHYGYVYCMTFPNGKKYVGQTIRPWKLRWKHHKSKGSYCVALKNAFAKYGIENSSWELLAYASTQDELNSLECSYITNLNTVAPNGYNLKYGGEGHCYSEETKEKMRLSNTIAHMKKRLSELEREQMTEEELEEQAKERILAKQKRKTHSPLRKPRPIKIITEAELIERAKKKILAKKMRSESDAGFNIISFLTVGHENICVSSAQYNSIIHCRQTYNDPIKGTELRKKLSEIQKKLRSRPILCVETGEVFSCTTEALEKHPEWSRSKINSCCAKIIKSHHGLHFRYNDLREAEIRDLKEFWKEKPRPCSGFCKPKEVLWLETGEKFPSAAAVAKVLNSKDSCISRVCSGQRSSYKGLHFSYL